MAEKGKGLLPRFIVLKSQKNDKYLIHQRDDKDYLQFSGTDFRSLNVKHEVVPSSKEDGLVHLKCCYNQKYWVRCTNNYWRITANAHEMEEDQTKSSCTLFKPVFFTSNRIGFCHVNLNRNLIFDYNEPFYLYVYNATNEADYLDFFDWDTLPILPRYIALKGDCGNYLSLCTSEPIKVSGESFGTLPTLLSPASQVAKFDSKASDYMDLINNVAKAVKFVAEGVNSFNEATRDQNYYLSFNCNFKGHPAVRNEVFTTPDGKIRLKNKFMGKFWKLSPSWIRPDSEDETNNNLDTLFEVVKVDQKIALKNLGNNKYCQRFSADGDKKGCLNANSINIPEETFLVENLVAKIKINNVRLHREAAKIYEKEIKREVMSTDFNDTYKCKKEIIFYEFTREWSRTWTTSSNPLNHTIETEISGECADVSSQGGQIKYVPAGPYEKVTNGKTLNVKEPHKFSRDYTVLPNSKIVATFRVKHVMCDIPFSYRQTEICCMGRKVIPTIGTTVFTPVSLPLTISARTRYIIDDEMWNHETPLVL